MRFLNTTSTPPGGTTNAVCRGPRGSGKFHFSLITKGTQNHLLRKNSQSLQYPKVDPKIQQITGKTPGKIGVAKRNGWGLTLHAEQHARGTCLRS